MFIIFHVSSGWFWRACLPHILASPSVLLKQVSKFSSIWITQTPHYSTDFSEYFNHFFFFFLNLSFRVSHVFMKHLPFSHVRIGIFLSNLELCFQPSWFQGCPTSPTPAPRRLSPCPSRPHQCPHGQALLLGCSGLWPSLPHERLAPPSLAWHLVVNSHVTGTKSPVLSSTIITVSSSLDPMSLNIVLSSWFFF